jgi:protein SCO1
MRAIFPHAVHASCVVALAACAFAARTTAVTTRYADGRVETLTRYRDGVRDGAYRAWWPDGRIKTAAAYRADALDGEYRTWYASGRPFEVRHYASGRESGAQQSWTEAGELFLNYEVRDGRRFGFVNARPCVSVAPPPGSGVRDPEIGSGRARSFDTGSAPRDGLPYYDGFDFSPRWSRPATSRPFTFDLVSQRGARVTDAALRGRIHVASFIFTRCSGICPALTRQLRRVQEQAPKDVLMVSYSVTPDLDSPADLAAFGRAQRIDPDRWLLLTGSAAPIYRLARDFYFADDRRVRAADEFLHTEKVLLVDRRGDLRGVYNGTVPFDMERLLADIRRLESN